MPSGRSSEIAFAFQTAKGSPAAASTRRIVLTGGSLPWGRPVVGADSAIRTVRADLQPVTTTVIAAGAPEAYVRPGMIGALLYAVLGGKAVAGGSDPWTHTITLGTSVPWLTLWTHYAGLLNERASDVRIRRLVIAGRSGEPLRVTFEPLSGLPEYRTAQETAVAVEAADALMMRHGAGALKLEGAAVASINDFALTIEAGVEIVEALTGPTPMLSGRTSIRLSVDQRLVDATLWARMVYGSSSPANLADPTLTPLELAGSPAGAEFTFVEQASPERSLKLALPRLALQDLAGNDPTTTYAPARQRLELVAYPAGSASPITATVKNAVSSY